MFLLDERVIASASDLTLASRCEFALVRAVDVVLGRAPRLKVADDPMLAYTARLGDEHEEAVLRSYVERFGPWDPASGRGVREVEPPVVRDRTSLLRARAETYDALTAGADVVFQASFFDGRFHGRADFLVRDGDRYAVVDSKLARRAKVQALLQIAAYADQLRLAGFAPAPAARLVLGDRSEAEFPIADLLPVLRERQARLDATVAARVAEAEPVRWGDPRYAACGRCAVCEAEIVGQRDVLNVARLGVRHQIRLRDAGITTIDELAATTTPVDGIPERVLAGFRTQARLQVRQDPPDGSPGAAGVQVVDPGVLAALPPPDPGDLFFDFEGDPLWTGGGPSDWGIEYLFGVVEAAEPVESGVEGPAMYRYWWADDRAEEKEALTAFLDYVEKRRARHPGMHIYHYAAYEKTALLALAGRHGVGEDAVDALLRAGVLVDLYAAVRAGVRVSQRSYSIKKLEPFYMGEELRESDVTSGGASVVAYDTYTRLRAAGDETGADRLRGELLDYNRYDCVSTLRLRDWLLSMLPPGSAPAVLVPEPRAPDDDETTGLSITPFEQRLIETLAAAAGPRDGRGADRQAAAMVAAAVGYHRREEKPFWWAHYDRLAAPVDEWAGGRDVFVIEDGRVAWPWQRPTGRSKERRGLDLVGRFAVGSSLSEGASVFGVYDPPLPRGVRARPGAVRAAITGLTVTATDVDASGRDIVRVEQIIRDGLADHPALPIALTPSPPPKPTSIHVAVVGVAERIADALDGDVPVAAALPPLAGVDLLRRLPPRVRGSGLPAVADGDDAGAITRALLDMDSSYVAVQGPPGTGKTYVGARVIARLVVDHGWRVGVVAQSHSAIENMLEAVVAAGVPADRVAKKPHAARGRWTPIPDTDIAAFLEAHRRTGAVFGGTMWDLTHPGRVVPGSLDLVVVDEAGQYSLANTLGVSTAGRRLLLLGDPQQLPQVSQGTHPEPVDDSALGWLTEGHGSLPERYGYFLHRTWRMHSALTERVSRLAYDGRLESETAVTDVRSLEGVPPGVHVVTVPHRGNSVQSEEEATEVVAQVRAHLGLTWTVPADPADPAGDPISRPLEPVDVMVVAPYNAQVGLIRQRLRDAGLVDVPVGTVDKFQGRQAPVVIMSMTASSGAEVPRGSGFLFSRHRMNVAVSRGQWRAVIVRSDILTEVMPRTPDQLTELGAFIALCSGT